MLKFHKNKEITEFLDFLTAKWFTPQNLGPIRITENEQASLIDNFLSTLMIGAALVETSLKKSVTIFQIFS